MNKKTLKKEFLFAILLSCVNSQVSYCGKGSQSGKDPDSNEYTRRKAPTFSKREKADGFWSIGKKWATSPDAMRALKVVGVGASLCFLASKFQDHPLPHPIVSPVLDSIQDVGKGVSVEASILSSNDLEWWVKSCSTSVVLGVVGLAFIKIVNNQIKWVADSVIAEANTKVDQAITGAQKVITETVKGVVKGAAEGAVKAVQEGIDGGVNRVVQHITREPVINADNRGNAIVTFLKREGPKAVADQLGRLLLSRPVWLAGVAAQLTASYFGGWGLIPVTQLVVVLCAGYSNVMPVLDVPMILLSIASYAVRGRAADVSENDHPVYQYYQDMDDSQQVAVSPEKTKENKGEEQKKLGVSGKGPISGQSVVENQESVDSISPLVTKFCSNPIFDWSKNLPTSVLVDPAMISVGNTESESSVLKDVTDEWLQQQNFDSGKYDNQDLYRPFFLQNAVTCPKEGVLLKYLK